MATVYIVTNGNHEEYAVVAVFSTMEKAKEFVNHNGWEFEIEEHAIDVPFKKYPKLWEVTLSWENSRLLECRVHEQLPPYVEYIHYEGGKVQILVRSETVPGAIKSAAEKLKRIRELEETKFPLLKNRVVAHSPLDIMPDFPTYNYRTGGIILYPMWELVPGIEAPTEVREIAL